MIVPVEKTEQKNWEGTEQQTWYDNIFYPLGKIKEEGNPLCCEVDVHRGFEVLFFLLLFSLKSLYVGQESWLGLAK